MNVPRPAAEGVAEEALEGDAEDEPIPLLERMGAEAATVLGAAGRDDRAAWVAGAVEAGDTAAARSRIAVCYRELLEDHFEAARHRHLEIVRRRGVEPAHCDEVVQSVHVGALRSVDLFAAAERLYAGDDPTRATPMSSSVEAFVANRLRWAVTRHGSDKGMARDRLAGDADVTVIRAADDPESEAGFRAIVAARRTLLRTGREVVALDLASPDLQARRAGKDRTRMQRLLVPLVLEHLTLIDPLVEEPRLPTDEVVSAVGEAFGQVCRVDLPDEVDGTRHQFIHRNRPEALFAVRTALQWATTTPLPRDPFGAGEDARLDLAGVVSALTVEVVGPLAVRLRVRMSGVGGGPGFGASLGWLQETLAWLAVETSTTQLLAAVEAARTALDAPSSVAGTSAREEAQRHLAPSDRLRAEAEDLLALGDRLDQLAVELRRTTGEMSA